VNRRTQGSNRQRQSFSPIGYIYRSNNRKAEAEPVGGAPLRSEFAGHRKETVHPIPSGVWVKI
jgi:hypothetical protein